MLASRDPGRCCATMSWALACRRGTQGGGLAEHEGSDASEARQRPRGRAGRPCLRGRSSGYTLRCRSTCGRATVGEECGRAAGTARNRRERDRANVRRGGVRRKQRLRHPRSRLFSSPSHLRSAVNTQVRAGMLSPMANVSVLNRHCRWDRSGTGGRLAATVGGLQQQFGRTLIGKPDKQAVQVPGSRRTRHNRGASLGNGPCARCLPACRQSLAGRAHPRTPWKPSVRKVVPQPAAVYRTRMLRRVASPHLDQLLLEQDLHQLLQYGQQACGAWPSVAGAGRGGWVGRRAASQAAAGPPGLHSERVTNAWGPRGLPWERSLPSGHPGCSPQTGRQVRFKRPAERVGWGGVGWGGRARAYPSDALPRPPGAWAAWP